MNEREKLLIDAIEKAVPNEGNTYNFYVRDIEKHVGAKVDMTIMRAVLHGLYLAGTVLMVTEEKEGTLGQATVTLAKVTADLIKVRETLK